MPDSSATTLTGPDDLAFFAVLARHPSLAAAGRALNITPPAVTRRLALLEQRLGVRLLNRSTRRFSLTAEGEILLARADDILASIRAAEDEVAGSRRAPRGLLRINASLGFGRTVIGPLVSAFARRYPEVQAQLQLTDRPVDLVDEAFDLAIRFGELPDTRLSARRLMRNRRFLCASPAYLKQHGAPQTLADLAVHRCIIHRQNNEAYGTWRFARGKSQGFTEVVKVQGALASNDGDVALGWALDGHGILPRSEWDARKYLDSGRLQLVLPAYSLPGADLFVYYPSRRNQAARARAFIDFLTEHLAGSLAGAAIPPGRPRS